MTDDVEQIVYAVSYARVSTDDKDQKPESQLHAIREWAKKKGNIQIVKEFQDKATGTNDEREGLDQIYGFKRRHPEVTRLIVLDGDRLSRNMDDAPKIIKDFNDIGINVVYVSNDALDFNTKEGKLMNAMKSYSAQAYTDELKLKIRAGMQRAKAEGKHIGRPSKRGEDSINTDILLEFGKRGYSLRKCEKIFKVSRNTLVRALREKGLYEEFKKNQESFKNQNMP